jgi:signal transduction histidine kinase
MVDADGAAVGAERERLHARQGAFASVSALAVAAWMATIAAGSVPDTLLAAWLLASALAVAASASALPALRRLKDDQFPAAARLQQAGAALAGLVSGAAATLFLPALSWPARAALSVAACAGLAGAIVEPGRQGPAFRLQLACCAGQFALAWWRLGEPGAAQVAWALAGFAVLAAATSTAIDRLNRQSLARAIENRRLAESLAQARDEAVAADRAKSHFIAAASHDLRQPAAALALTASLLRRQVGDPALAPAMQGLERSVATLNDLLGQLLDLSRLDAGRIAPEIRPVAIDDLIRELLREIAPQAGARGLRLRAIGSGCELDCDPVLVARMLRNLLDNALRHTERGGITVTARAVAARSGAVRAGATFEIAVADSGCGIAPEHQRRVFDEHYQIGNAARQRGNGLGLGLALVRRIAALHDASVSLRSTPGRGSRFTLRFHGAASRPLAAGLAPPGEALPAGGNTQDTKPEPEPAPAPARRPRLLLVEDDELLADAFGQWLSAAGFEVSRAADGASAQAILAAGRPLAAVLSDFRLPGEPDGIALLEQVRERHPAALRILVSGDIDPALPSRAAEAGLPLLAKPVDLKRLRGLLASRLG